MIRISLAQLASIALALTLPTMMHAKAEESPEEQACRRFVYKQVEELGVEKVTILAEIAATNEIRKFHRLINELLNDQSPAAENERKLRETFFRSDTSEDQDNADAALINLIGSKTYLSESEKYNFGYNGFTKSISWDLHKQNLVDPFSHKKYEIFFALNYKFGSKIFNLRVSNKSRVNSIDMSEYFSHHASYISPIYCNQFNDSEARLQH